jgi:hypothetical protein
MLSGRSSESITPLKKRIHSGRMLSAWALIRTCAPNPPRRLSSSRRRRSRSARWHKPAHFLMGGCAPSGRGERIRLLFILWGRQAVGVQVPRPPPSHWKRLRGFSNILGLDAAPPAPGCCSSTRVATQRSLWGSGRVLGVVTVETRPARAAARNARHQRLCVDVPDGDLCDGIWGSGRRRCLCAQRCDAAAAAAAGVCHHRPCASRRRCRPPSAPSQTSRRSWSARTAGTWRGPWSVSPVR